LLDNSTLQVLIVAIIAGIVLNYYAGKEQIVSFLKILSNIFLKVFTK